MKKIVQTCLCGISAVAFGTAAEAQEAVAPPSTTPPSSIRATDDTAIPDIVVTATRREESLKDVPLSIQAVSPEAISRRAIQDTQDLAALVPTVNFASGNSANAQGLALRGVSSVAIQNGIQPSVAIVIDGVPIARQSEFVIDLGDIQRIEILNGPQGTLFGKNSTAGVLNIVTGQPTDRLEARVEGLATFDEEYSVRGMLNVPIAEGLRLRATAFYRDQNPLIRNFTGPDVLGLEAYGASIKLAYDISPTATYTLSGIYSHTDSSRGQIIQIGGNVFGALYTNLIAPARIGRGADTINTDSPAHDIYESRNVTGTLNWALARNLDLVAITAYTRYNEDSIIDLDLTPQSVKIGTGLSRPGVYYPLYNVDYGIGDRFPDRFHYVSQEVRLNYHDDRWNAIVGGYFQDYHDRYQLKLASLIDGGILGLTPGVLFYSLNLPRGVIDDRTLSIFGDTTYTLTDQVKLFGGLRYTNERIDVVYHRDVYLGPSSALNQITGVFALPPIQTVDTSATRSVDNLSGRAGIQFQPAADLNFYASYSRGYKGPAVDVGQNSPAGAGQTPILQPEKADAFEIGAKLRLFGRLALNAAIFDQTIHDIQINSVRAGAATLVSQLINAGNLRTRGVEADFDLAAAPGLRLSGSVAYNDATYGTYAYRCNPRQTATSTCPNYLATGFQNIEGNPALTSPKWKYSLAADYTGNVTSSLSYFLHTDFVWSDAVQYSLDNDPLTREPGHGLLNASVGVRGGNWEVQLFGKNLTNRFYYSNLGDLAILGAPLGNLSRDYKRYGGLRLVVHY